MLSMDILETASLLKCSTIAYMSIITIIIVYKQSALYELIRLN